MFVSSEGLVFSSSLSLFSFNHFNSLFFFSSERKETKQKRSNHGGTYFILRIEVDSISGRALMACAHASVRRARPCAPSKAPRRGEREMLMVKRHFDQERASSISPSPSFSSRRPAFQLPGIASK